MCRMDFGNVGGGWKGGAGAGKRGKVALHKGVPGGKELGRISGGGGDGFACKTVVLTISRRSEDSLNDGQGIAALCHSMTQKASGSADAPRRDMLGCVDQLLCFLARAVGVNRGSRRNGGTWSNKRVRGGWRHGGFAER